MQCFLKQVNEEEDFGVEYSNYMEMDEDDFECDENDEHEDGYVEVIEGEEGDPVDWDEAAMHKEEEVANGEGVASESVAAIQAAFERLTSSHRAELNSATSSLGGSSDSTRIRMGPQPWSDDDVQMNWKFTSKKRQTSYKKSKKRNKKRRYAAAAIKGSLDGGMEDAAQQIAVEEYKKVSD